MISLRQHLFSLIAVFVALAIGIAAGSTVVRGPLLDSTRARLESAEEVIAAERAENELLTAEVAQLDGWAVDGPEPGSAAAAQRPRKGIPHDPSIGPASVGGGRRSTRVADRPCRRTSRPSTR